MGEGSKRRQAGSHLQFTLYCKHTLPRTHNTPAYAGEHTERSAGGQRRDAVQRQAANWQPGRLLRHSGRTRVMVRARSSEPGRVNAGASAGGTTSRVVNAPQGSHEQMCPKPLKKRLNILIISSDARKKRRKHTAEREEGHLKVRPHIRTYISSIMSSANSHSWMGTRAEIQMKTQRWETECEENPRSKGLDIPQRGHSPRKDPSLKSGGVSGSLWAKKEEKRDAWLVTRCQL